MIRPPAVPQPLLVAQWTTRSKPEEKPPVRVQLLYFDGCPHWTVAEERLAQALRTLGRDDTAVEHLRVETPEQAEELKFLGSPTIRIDGTDPFATGRAPVGLACRVYTTPDGLSGSPTTEQLLEVLS
jgi:hypothetical protein